MLTFATIENLKSLRLFGMAKALQEQMEQSDIDTLSFSDRLALLIDRETIERDNKRLASRLKRQN